MEPTRPEQPVLLAYRAEWTAQFAQAAAAIEAALGGLLTGPVEHIGSTAVPGMIAKPHIDMMAPVADLDAARAAAPALAELGYHRRPHRQDAELYVAGGDADGPAGTTFTHGVHLTPRTSDLWHERLTFRDALRADAELRDAYIDLKLVMLAGPERYDSKAKRDFVRAALARYGHTLRDGWHTPPTEPSTPPPTEA